MVEHDIANTGIEVYRDIIPKCLNLHTADIAQDTDHTRNTSTGNKGNAKRLIRAKNMVNNKPYYLKC